MDAQLICSGKSSEKIDITSQTIIVANLSILVKYLNKEINKDLKIIWFLGPNYRVFDYTKINDHIVFKKIIPNLKITPSEIHIEHVGFNYNFKHFSKCLKKYLSKFSNI